MIYHKPSTEATDALRAFVGTLTQHYPAHTLLAALRAVTGELYQTHRTPVQTIVDTVAAAHGLTTAAMLAPRRTAALSQARHHAAWEIRHRRPDIPLTKIAAWLNRTNHATVIHSLTTWQAVVDAGGYEKERALVERALA